MTKPKDGRYRWFKFWPRDWLADECLSSCSLAAQGLWIRLVSLIHECDDAGRLTVNGKPAKLSRIANMVGRGESEVGPLVAELEESGVFSRDEDGAIYSRRMAREARSNDEGEPVGTPPETLGVSEGCPAGDPKGAPRDADGQSPPRARASQKPEEKRTEEKKPEEKKPEAEGESAHTREPTHPLQVISKAFTDRYQRIHGEKYAFVGTRDGKALRELLALSGGTTAAALTKLAQADGDAFWRDKLTTLPKFVAAWNDLVAIKPGALRAVPGAPTDDAIAYARKQAASNSPSLQAEGREKLQRWGLLAPAPVNGTAVHA